MHIHDMHNAYSSKADVIIRASSYPVTTIPAAACPLCDDLDKLSSTNGPDSEKSTQMSLDSFRCHLSSHLVQIATFTVSQNLELSEEGRTIKKRAKSKEAASSTTVLVNC